MSRVCVHHHDIAPDPSVSSIIKGIKSLGGSVGFQSFTENPQTTLSVADVQGTAVINDYPQTTFSVVDVQATADTNDSEWSSCHAWGFAAGAWFVTAITLRADGHEGAGHAWGPAFGAGNLQGVLTYKSFNANGFSFQNVGGAATAWMTSDGSLTSQFTGALIGISVSLSFGGDWHW